MSKYRVHVIPHTHWDKEWYFTTSRSQVYLYHDVKNILQVLEEDQEFRKFVLDGQSSLLDDYLKWAPEDEDRIKKLVKERKLMIGPWYTQSDLMLISAESIVRNMYYGLKRAEDFGDPMDVAYVPDSFGQAGNMPQIYKDFGFDSTVFWRGVSDDECNKTSFQWEGTDGTVINAFQIPQGYYIGGHLPTDANDLTEVMNNELIQRVKSRSINGVVALPNGFDQAPIRSNLSSLVNMYNKNQGEYEFVISDYNEYIENVLSSDPVLEKVKGELVTPKLSRVHKTIFSSRSDLKQLNTKTQNYIVNVLEPLLVIASELGERYPHEAMKEIWYLMFQNAAHDSIGSCVSDTTNEDIYLRYKKINDLSLNLVELYARLISTRIKNDKEFITTLTIFNTLPYKRDATIKKTIYTTNKDFEIVDKDGSFIAYDIIHSVNRSDYIRNQTNNVDASKKVFIPQEIYETEIVIEFRDLPSMGFQQFYVIETEKSLQIQPEFVEFIENEYYTIKPNKNGTVDIVDKLSKVTYRNQMLLQENGDGGDSFNYSPAKEDLVITNQDLIAHTSCVKTKTHQKIIIDYVMKLPKDLEERAAGKCSTNSNIHIELVLKNNSRVIDVDLTIENNVLSHRFCLLFNTALAQEFSFAGHHFGAIRRPVQILDQLELWKNNKKDWEEKPIAIEPLQDYVALGEQRGVAVMPGGVREYEVIGDDFDTLAITILRTYSFMGKEDLEYRPGRASGETIHATPDAELQGTFKTALGVMYYQNDINTDGVAKEAREYNTDVELYQYADFLNGRLIFTLEDDQEQDLAQDFSLVTFLNEELQLSSLRRTIDNDLVIRVFNPYYDIKEVKDSITMNRTCKFFESNLNENKGNLMEDNNKVDITLGHNKFQTIIIE